MIGVFQFWAHSALIPPSKSHIPKDCIGFRFGDVCVCRFTAARTRTFHVNCHFAFAFGRCQESESVDAVLGTMMGTLAEGLYVDGTFGRGGHSRSVLVGPPKELQNSTRSLSIYDLHQPCIPAMERYIFYL